MESLLQQLGVFGTGILCGLGILGLFWKADEGFSKEFKEELSLYLSCSKVSEKSNWASYFVALFDWWYTPNLISFKAFFRSVLTSFICVLILGSSYFLLATNSVAFSETDLKVQLALDFMKDTAWMFLRFNIVLDYASLIGSRYIIGKIANCERSIKILYLLVLNVLLTLSFCAICMTVFESFLFGTYAWGDYRPLKWFIWIPYSMLGFVIAPESRAGIQYLAVFFLSAFFTSVWVWGFALATLLVRNANFFNKLLEKTQFILPVFEKPMRSIGIISSILVMIGYWINAYAFHPVLSLLEYFKDLSDPGYF